MTSLRPIESATAVAALRAASLRERDPGARNPDYLASHFVTGNYAGLLRLPHWLLRPLVEQITPGGYSFILARTRFFDEQLLRAVAGGAKQVVLLGAGYDTRAYRFANELAGVTVFEVDLPATQAAKRSRLEGAKVDARVNVRYVATDLTKSSLEAELSREEFAFDAPTAFIWEGVCYYLHEAAAREVFELVGRRCAPGTSLSFDYALASFVAGDDSTYGAAAVQKWLKKHQEPFHFGVLPGKLGDVLDPHGLTLVDDYGPDELRERYLTRTDGGQVGRPYEHLRLAHSVRN
jgi:methyltransferase (TIGR00027 family)